MRGLVTRASYDPGRVADNGSEDGTVRVNLAVVVYVQTDRSEHRVGFGAS